MKDTAHYYEIVKLFLPKAEGLQGQQTYSFTHSYPVVGGEWSTSRAGRFSLGKEPQGLLNKRLGGPIVSVWMLRNFIIIIIIIIIIILKIIITHFLLYEMKVRNVNGLEISEYLFLYYITVTISSSYILI